MIYAKYYWNIEKVTTYKYMYSHNKPLEKLNLSHFKPN